MSITSRRLALPALALALLLAWPGLCSARGARVSAPQAALERRLQTTQCLAPEARARQLVQLAQSMLRDGPAEAWVGDALLVEAVQLVGRFHPLLSDAALAGLRAVLGPLEDASATRLAAHYAERPDLRESLRQDEATQAVRLGAVLDVAAAARRGEAALAGLCDAGGCAAPSVRDAVLASASPSQIGLAADSDPLTRTTREFAARPPPARAAYVLDAIVVAARAEPDEYDARALVEHAILLLRTLDSERSDAALAELARGAAFLVDRGVAPVAAAAFDARGRLADGAHFARILAGTVKVDARRADALARYSPCWSLVPAPSR